MTTDTKRCLTLVIFDEQALVKAAFQSYWFDRVTIFGQQCDWLQFEASGIFRGHVGGQGATTLELPATPAIWTLCLQALASAGRWMAKVQLYEFEGGESIPPNNMRLIGTTRGQIVNASNDPITTLKLELGTSLSPTGAQVPWRTATTRLIGPGMKG
jgi:hypothetical protein